jgi:hypothetical protein
VAASLSPADLHGREGEFDTFSSKALLIIAYALRGITNCSPGSVIIFSRICLISLRARSRSLS